MPRIAAGVVKFQQEAFPKRRELYDQLSTGQEPEALFITCSDSRISPNLMTSTEPGEIFIVRNAGNIVPPHTLHTGGTTATIEYAVAALKVKHIVVCGHTGCGAMAGAMAPETLGGLPHVAEWLAYARAAVQTVQELGQGKSDEEKMRLLIEQNVLLQLTHLKTHPYVAAALAAGRVQLHGWVYDIASGEVVAWDENDERFEPVAERYKNEVAEYAAQVTAQDH
ncbi:carbonic anhydrase [Parvularcula dongshanensis]|uniref:Carbonic anhydrase n=1 Tax=Parvularcula dongshanensis TaxID=1173995 RepID=A0A840I215_9PROT|nr:carbonic anhydrase [Parvularcula dongshanensis]MBB4658323.1 carbonic anhydrase [Parvularcula dongshanensis]